jgi:hypothetical protein
VDFCIEDVEAYVSMSYNIGAVKCVGGGGRVGGGQVNLLICDRDGTKVLLIQDTPLGGSLKVFLEGSGVLNR